MNKIFQLTSVALAVALAGCASPTTGEKVTAAQAPVEKTIKATVATTGFGETAGPMVRGGAAESDLRAAEQAAQPVLRRSSRPWVASISVPMTAGESLPSVFADPIVINFDDSKSAGKVSLRTVAERITALTHVPVRVKSDVFTPDAASGPTRVVSADPKSTGADGQAAVAIASSASAPGGAPTAAMPGALPTFNGGPLPTGGTMALPSMGASQMTIRETSASAVSMKWKGSLEGYLNHVTDMLSLSWEYRDGAVVIERYKTEFFEIALLESESSYQMGINSSDQTTASTTSGAGSGSGGTGTSNATADVKESGKVDAMKSIIAGVNQIIASTPGSGVVLNSGSGRIAVTTTKDAMTKVQQYIRAENAAMLRQAQIQFDIYSVIHTDDDEHGVDWNLVFQSVSRAFGATVASPASLVASTAGSVGFTVLDTSQAPGSRTAARWGGSSEMLQLLNKVGSTTTYRPVSLLTLNRQWARKANLNNKAYVSQTTPGVATSLGAGAPGLTTSTITTGDRYLVQPYILDNNTVVLKFGLGLSSLLDIANFTSGQGTSQQTVQTPETQANIDQATVSLKAGQVLAISGLSRIIATDTKSTLADGVPVAAGGSVVKTRQREDFIIFVRPSIL